MNLQTKQTHILCHLHSNGSPYPFVCLNIRHINISNPPISQDYQKYTSSLFFGNDGHRTRFCNILTFTIENV